MVVELSPALEAVVRSSVKSGRFPSAQAAVEQLLLSTPALQGEWTAYERAAIEEGLADMRAGRVQTFESDEGLFEYFDRLCSK